MKIDIYCVYCNRLWQTLFCLLHSHFAITKMSRANFTLSSPEVHVSAKTFPFTHTAKVSSHSSIPFSVFELVNGNWVLSFNMLKKCARPQSMFDCTINWLCFFFLSSNFVYARAHLVFIHAPSPKKILPTAPDSSENIWKRRNQKIKKHCNAQTHSHNSQSMTVSVTNISNTNILHNWQLLFDTLLN